MFSMNKRPIGLSDRERKRMCISLALGVSPIPVVGEVFLTKSFYDILKSSDAPIFSESKASTVGIAAACACLTRVGMYAEVYVPLYKKVIDMFS